MDSAPGFYPGCRRFESGQVLLFGKMEVIQIVLDCGCDVCKTYHEHRRQVRLEERAAYEKAREQTDERRTLKRANFAKWKVEHHHGQKKKKNNKEK